MKLKQQPEDFVVVEENQVAQRHAGTGGFGFYCRLLDTGLETSGAPR